MTSTQGQRHSLRERGNDLYETPLVAVQALLTVEQLPLTVWEPACGRGAIAKPLRAAGYTVVATDLVDYAVPDQDQAGIDFLFERTAPPEVEAIVTNPPFKLANQFAAHALELVPRVCLLLRLAFLESEARSPILDSGRLARVLPFRRRLPMMHRDGWTGPRSTNPTAYAWFVWDVDHRGPTEVRRISWTEDGAHG